MEEPGPTESNEKTRTMEEEERSSMVEVSWCDSTPLLFRMADMKVVRELGVVGTPVGSLPRQPRQNNRLGRPLLLLHEEARLVAELGRAVTLPTGQDEGGEEEEREVKRRSLVERYEEQQESSYDEQCVLALEDRKEMLLAALQIDGNRSGGQHQAMEGRLRSLEQSFAFPRSAMSVQLNTAGVGLDRWPDDRDHLHTRLYASPSDQTSETRYRVFRDLRARGFFLTPAGKFGGDFLVYPGDPLLFHAHYIAVCVRLDEHMSPCDILSVARLGSGVKKTVLLCSPGPEDGRGHVLYTSLQWSGMV